MSAGRPLRAGQFRSPSARAAAPNASTRPQPQIPDGRATAVRPRQAHLRQEASARCRRWRPGHPSTPSSSPARRGRPPPAAGQPRPSRDRPLRGPAGEAALRADRQDLLSHDRPTAERAARPAPAPPRAAALRATARRRVPISQWPVTVKHQVDEEHPGLTGWDAAGDVLAADAGEERAAYLQPATPVFDHGLPRQAVRGARTRNLGVLPAPFKSASGHDRLRTARSRRSRRSRNPTARYALRAAVL